MRALLINLLALLLLVPGSLGCCWHSLFAGTPALVLESTTDVDSLACQHCCAECERTRSPARPAKCKLTCQSSRVYLPAPKMQRAPEPLVLSLEIVPEPLSPLACPVAPGICCKNCDRAEVAELPVRLHALKSCYLI